MVDQQEDHQSFQILIANGELPLRMWPNDKGIHWLRSKNLQKCLPNSFGKINIKLSYISKDNYLIES